MSSGRADVTGLQASGRASWEGEVCVCACKNRIAVSPADALGPVNLRGDEQVHIRQNGVSLEGLSFGGKGCQPWLRTRSLHHFEQTHVVSLSLHSVSPELLKPRPSPPQGLLTPFI